ncbi:MAG: amidohydrolase, partial [Clostridia bacterium]|nr:amidohydrolase [Clostridia bacterium]
MEIIDIHAHVYPDKVSNKAVKNIGDFYSLKMFGDGKWSTLLSDGDKVGVTKYAIHSVATKKEQVQSINRFILETAGFCGKFLPFGTLHPDMTEEELESEICFLIQSGFKGIKLHPDFQRFYIDGEDSKRICRVLDGRLPILFHTGDDKLDFSMPERLNNLAADFKNQIFIGAHFGSYRCFDKADIYTAENVYFDTSSALMFISKERATRLIDKFGDERFLWGSDYPMWLPSVEYERFLSLDLSSATTAETFIWTAITSTSLTPSSVRITRAAPTFSSACLSVRRARTSALLRSAPTAQDTAG